MENINWNDFKKKVGDQYYECTFNQQELICSSYTDNPHDNNNETCCGLKEFLEKKTGNAITCHSIIKADFGDDKLETFIYFAEKHYQSFVNKKSSK